MKRHLSILCVVSISLCAVACSQQNAQPPAEDSQPSLQIRFNEIEWGSSCASVLELIGSESASVANSAYMAYPDTPFDYAPLAANAGNILTASSIDVLGYDAISTLFFSYCLTDSNAVDTSRDSLYLVRSQILAEDCEAGYNDICANLTALYGEGHESTRTGQSLAVGADGVSTFDRTIFESSWTGAENTFVRIKLEVPNAADTSPTLFVAFGNLGAVDTLNAIATA